MPGTVLVLNIMNKLDDSYILSLQSSENGMQNKDVNKYITINDVKGNEVKELCSVREVSVEE